jgi:hypothetical protein
MNDQVKQPRNDLKNTQHLFYLLRLWRTGGAQDFEWRASLDIPETGERIGFANLEQLFAYVIDLTKGQATTRYRTETTEARNGQ